MATTILLFLYISCLEISFFKNKKISCSWATFLNCSNLSSALQHGLGGPTRGKGHNVLGSVQTNQKRQSLPQSILV